MHTHTHMHIHTRPPPHTHTGFLRQVGRTDILYKPVQYGSKGNREVQFYEMIFNNSEDQLTSDLRTLKQLIPQYYGLEDIRDHYGDVGECGCVNVLV